MKRTKFNQWLSPAITVAVALVLAAGTLPTRPAEAANSQSAPAQNYVTPGAASWKTGGGGNGTSMYLDPVGGSRLGIGTASPKQMLHIMSGLDANLTDGTGFVIIGDQDGKNIVLDDNEIMARTDGATSPLFVQARGGRFTVGPDNGVNVSIENNQMWAKQNGEAIPMLFPQGTDAKLDVVSGYLIVGDRLANNVAIDENEIMARNNGAPATLHVQAEGGAFAVQEDKLVVDANGVLAVRGDKLVVTQEGDVGIGTNDPRGTSGFGDCAYECYHLAATGNIYSAGLVAAPFLWAKVGVNIGPNYIARPGEISAPELAVDGTIIAKEIIVTTEGWADHVFEEDFELMPLAEVEASIRANGHLPGVPSKAEIVGEGIDLAEMNRTLMQKVEELTLYAIEQDKRITQLEQLLAPQSPDAQSPAQLSAAVGVTEAD